MKSSEYIEECDRSFLQEGVNLGLCNLIEPIIECGCYGKNIEKACHPFISSGKA
jgi:hypothetical protein